jgi:16S rRNA (guanine527-N7)-methyltransferase
MGDNMEEDLTEVLMEGARALGVELPTSSLEALDFFLNELMRWNRKMNLTGIKDPHGIVVKHFLDSVAVSPYISPGSSLLDVGSGAGFPCIVLKILDPGLKVTSIDSSAKKLSFQTHLIRQLGLKEIDAIQAHLPDPQVVERFNKVFDYAISRAFGSLGALLRIAGPLIKDTGIVIAMKGKMEGKDRASNDVAKQFNMKLQRTVSFTLPFTTADRTLLFFAKEEFP